MSAPSRLHLVTSSPGKVWREGEIREIDAGAAAPGAWIWRQDRRFQTIEGFGGCFNEQGWAVLGLLDASAREELLRRFFDSKQGCGFNLGRLPMGANDYSLDWFSYDETPGDYALAHFSVERDRQRLMPYLRAARVLAPDLRFWASPWCPPSWMKTNGHYAGRASENNDLRPDQAGEEMKTQFRMEPAVLDAYARYFVKFVEEYRREGIELYAVHVQNEPNSAQNFPSCVWRPEDLGTFIGRYLGPTFRKAGLGTEIWLGTIERPQLERVRAALETDGASAYVKGVGFQWAGKGAIPLVHAAYPSMPLMQTESECGDGSNDWAAASHTFGLIHHYLGNGAQAYLYWNLVLDETGNSRWGWRQNALVSVNRQTRAVTFNPEYYVMRHLSAFVQRGAVRVGVEAAGLPVLGFLNPDGTRVLVCENPQSTEYHASLCVEGQRIECVLPPKSFATLIF